MGKRFSGTWRVFCSLCLFSFILHELVTVQSTLRRFILDDDIELSRSPHANETWQVGPAHLSYEHLSVASVGAVPSSSIRSSDVASNTVGNANGSTEHKFAYAFAISGCDHDSCTGYILNVIVAAASLKHYNSTADVVIMIRMSKAANDTRLPSFQEQWLQKSGIKIRYHPKAIKEDNFGLAQMEKFRILELTDYDRVIHMDGDIIPACNLDYFFKASFGDDRILTEYTALWGGMTPVTGAFFMVQPREKEFDRVMDIVLRHRRRQHDATRFDPHLGWGHPMHGNDSWQGNSRKASQLWDMYGASVDQGVLYHWLKYELLNWTVITTRGEIITWQEVNPSHGVDQSLPVYEAPNRRWIAPVRKLPAGTLRGCDAPTYGRKRYMVRAPFVDFLHYYGGFKPFIKPINASLLPTVLTNKSTTMDVWYYFLRTANSTFDLELPSSFHFWAAKSLPLGAGPEKGDLLSPKVELPKPLTTYNCQETYFSGSGTQIFSCQ